ncbi:MAG: dipeptide ABC transporter ATP-binding protein [Rickettsiales bacterium]|nr:dipeptide ABC transporter ATP-binding protein [Rickettsiales bacterium]
MTLLAIDNLHVTFPGTEAVKGVSFSIARGEMVALVGESGSGKSLTALSCLQLQPHEARLQGQVLFEGGDLLKASPHMIKAIRGKRVGMIFQEPMTALNPLHTVRRQISEMFHDQKLSDAQIHTRLLELLEQVGLAHFKDRLDAYPHQLSGGERQRVMIAMAIANKPDLLIADEPTTAVDVTIQAKILKLIKELQLSMGMAVLFITHDLTVVRRLADKVVVMSKGEVVEQGPVKQVFTAPAHPYTQHLLASEPKGSPAPAPLDAKPVISCDKLKVYFPIRKGILRRVHGEVKAVKELSISIAESSTLGVVGESGSGKTTLGFALLRLIKSDGKIVFLGESTEQLRGQALRGLRNRMQMVFQDPYASLNPRMTIRQIIDEGLALHYPELRPGQRLEEIERILEEVGMPSNILERYPHEFSGGQRQRISIARAMVLKPKFVVLDEPTSALDLTIQSQIIELLKSFQQRYGLSYMFISHDLRVVRAISHHIAVLRGGELVEYADTNSIFTQPKTDYTKTLIEAAFLK